MHRECAIISAEEGARICSSLRAQCHAVRIYSMCLATSRYENNKLKSSAEETDDDAIQAAKTNMGIQGCKSLCVDTKKKKQLKQKKKKKKKTTRGKKFGTGSSAEKAEL